MKFEAVKEINDTLQERIINNEFCEDIAIETKKDENGGETIIIYINGGDGSGVD